MGVSSAINKTSGFSLLTSEIMLSANPYALTHSFVGADTHIGLLESCKFAEEYRKNGAFCRADVGIGPYKARTRVLCYRSSPTRLHVVQPVIVTSKNCPIRLSSPAKRTSLPPSVRAVSMSLSRPSQSTRTVLPT